MSLRPPSTLTRVPHALRLGLSWTVVALAAVGVLVGSLPGRTPDEAALLGAGTVTAVATLCALWFLPGKPRGGAAQASEGPEEILVPPSRPPAARGVALEEFIGAVSHDLRAPLATSRGFVRMAAEMLDQDDVEGARAILERSALAIARADQLVVDLHELARAGHAGEGEILDLEAIVQGVLGDLESTLAASGAEVRVDGPLGSIETDPRALRQVLSNLLGNAFRHGCAGDRKDVAVFTRRRPGVLELAIADHGPGIPRAQRQRAFAPFVQLEAGSAPAGEGSGLGLSLVARAMGSAGGTVHLEDTPGGGATVVLGFPARRSLQDQGSHPATLAGHAA